jgi:hypothetical protein
VQSWKREQLQLGLQELQELLLAHQQEQGALGQALAPEQVQAQLQAQLQVQ